MNSNLILHLNCPVLFPPRSLTYVDESLMYSPEQAAEPPALVQLAGADGADTAAHQLPGQVCQPQHVLMVRQQQAQLALRTQTHGLPGPGVRSENWVDVMGRGII